MVGNVQSLTCNFQIAHVVGNVQSLKMCSHKLQTDCVRTATDITDICLNCVVVLFGYPEITKQASYDWMILL